MTYKIYALRDKLTNAFFTPFYAHNNDVAIREITISFGQNQKLFEVANDIDLYVLGEFDDIKGNIKTQQAEAIITGAEIKAVIEKDILRRNILEKEIKNTIDTKREKTNAEVETTRSK